MDGERRVCKQAQCMQVLSRESANRIWEVNDIPSSGSKGYAKDRVMCTQVKRNTTEAVCQSTRKMWKRSQHDLVVGFKHGTSDKQTSANEKTRILFCTEGIARNEILALDRTKVSDTAIKGIRILLAR